MVKLWLDFETYSEVDIKLSGSHKYISHPSFHPWCAAYAINDDSVTLWNATSGNPDFLLEAIRNPAVKIYAHNAEFEWQILTKIFDEKIPLNKFVDCMALAGTFGYPLKLDLFAKAMGFDKGKTAGATRLINKLCVPQKKTAFNPTGKWTPATAPKDFSKLYEYCINDVIIMRKAVKRLPMDTLLPLEQYIWQHVVAQNTRGLPIDRLTSTSIQLVLEKFKIRQQAALFKLTGGAITGAKQVKRIREWLAERGVSMANLQVDTVQNWLEKDMPPECRALLLLRQELAHSSTAKFDKILYSIEADDRVRGNAVYFGAHTGRNAGRGFQLHNLPAAQHEDPQKAIEAFNKRSLSATLESYPEINDAGKRLVRPMIRASEGKKLVVVDYSSIENVVLHWTANDTVTTEEFRQGLDQYKTYAAARFGVKYENVTKDQRTYAKPCVLGLGFGGGAGALMYVAKGYGIDLEKKVAQKDVNFYRNKYKKVPELWSNVFVSAFSAVVTGDPQVLHTGTTKLEFRSAGGYLFVLLPSGRRISYPGVRVNATWSIMVNKKPVPMTSKLSYMGIKKNQFMRLGTHPGLLVENIVQAMARDILMYGLLIAEKAGYTMIGSIHDEGIAEVSDVPHLNHQDMAAYMCTLQDWAKDIPVRAAGYEAQRYRKD